MTSERWQRVKEILTATLEIPPAGRPQYLDRACEGDAGLRVEVESLLATYDETEDMLERPWHPAEDAGAMVGREAGGYRFLREIGEGGMSRVYLAERIGEGEPRQVAIKVVKRGMDYDFVLRRFNQERKIMAALDHPNISRLLDGGSTEDGIPYFVMEYIPGLPIDRYCDENHLSIRRRLQIFRTVCSAVQFAHERGVIHRDIKPGNILITPDGVTKLLDFGIAKVVDPEHWTQSFDMTASVLRLMTPEYASPEQVRGERIWEPTDIYSLGVLLYELLTGRRPYRVRSRAAHELARAICDEEPGRPSSVVAHRDDRPEGAGTSPTPEEVSERRGTQIPHLRRTLSGDLDNIVLMALRKEPRRRYVSVREMSEDIGRHLDGKSITARKDTVGYRTGKLMGRHRKAAIAASIAVPILLLGSVAAWRGTRAPSQPFAESAAPRIRPLTTLQGNETQPAFSPDGRRVAFVWSGEEGKNSDVYIRDLEGSALQRVTADPAEDVSPAWSPDGRQVAFLRTKNQFTAVFIAPLEGGVHRQIAEVNSNRIEAVGRHLDWSPDGKWLAVADKLAPEDPFSIYLVETATSRKQRLTNPPAKSIGDTGPVISPDGRWVSFLRSPASGIAEVWVASMAGGEARQVTNDKRSIVAQAWTQDGRTIIFSSNRTGGLTLWSVPVSGGTLKRLPGIGNNASEPSFSHDGRLLVYSQSFLDTNIWRIAAGPGVREPSPQKLISSTLYDSSAQYSPDGTRIAFRSDRTGYHEIWVCDAEGRNATQLTHFNGPLTGTPRWSPDNAWVAFDSRPEGQADIYVVASSGGKPRRMTFDASEDVVPSWSRDGKWIYFASNRSDSWQVWKMPFGDGPKVRVTHNGGFAAMESPDGRYLYYAISRSLPSLYRVPVEGGPEEMVLDRLRPGYWGYWAVGRDDIYFADTPLESSRSGLYRYALAGGAITRLAWVPKPLIIGDSAMALSPDGRSLLYTQVDQSGSDVMLADFGSR